jgi:hypothetical protein
MRIVYYTSGITGAGRLVIGIAIGNALNRKKVNCKYTLVHTSPAGHFADDFENIKIPLETTVELSPERCRSSILYKTLKKLKPDVMIVNHQWFTIYNFIDELPCRKIYISDQAYDAHFRVPLPGGDLVFNNGQYDRVLAIEPFTPPVPMERINPLIVRNRDEILDRETALERLNLDGSKKIALYNFSGKEGDYESHLKKYAYLDKEYDVVRISLFGDTLFPVVDYYSAFDLIVCGGGYNNVWSSVYFQKQSLFEPTHLNFSDHAMRIENSQNFNFDINGADQLADIILSL